ncbi:MAG: class I SAM-dependent methyltransferase [Eubacteriales bacterium]|nr:class I SAM-dependent methyltransferase [Eubacteriales bacterium]
MYGDFAAVYDRLMREVDYPAWAEHYRSLLLARGVPEGARVLEAACGTGSLTIPLAQHYQLLPGDQSPEMLSRAALKAKDAGLSLPFIGQDMRALSAHGPVGAIVCGCDGVNYLLSPADLRRFLKSAYQVLAPGGAIAFDISSFYKLSQVLGSNTLGLKEEDICYLWQNAWQPRSRRLGMQLSIFTRQPEGLWRLIEETQTQRAWEEEEIVRALGEAGFEDIESFGGMTLNKPAPQDIRLHFAATKPPTRTNI